MKTMRKILALCVAFALCAGLAVISASAGSVEHSYTAVSGGMSHTLAVKDDGTVWAWGSNDSKQLGISESGDQQKPVQVEDISNAVSVAAGYSFSAALAFDGTVKTWGSGNEKPTAVAGLTGVIAIAAGQTELLALKNDGTVWSWSASGASSVAQKVAGLSDIVAIASGGGHSMALSVSGQVYAWGRNDQGQLGLGDETDRTRPTLVPDLTDIVDIAAGSSHSLALGFNGQVYAWGSNEYGELGDGSADSSSKPVQTKTVKNAVQVAAGYKSSLALTTDGKIYTWGYGEYGQLGNNTSTISQSKPAAISFTAISETPAYLASGMYHALLVTSSGNVYAWGRNQKGQLGTGKSANAAAPQKVGNLVGKSGAYKLGAYVLPELQGLNSWSKPEILPLYETGFVSPMLWCQFSSKITRAEFAHLLVNVYDGAKGTSTTAGKAKFTDISASPLEQDVLKAYKLGLITGRSETIFDPDAPVTRQEAAKMLCSLVEKLTGSKIPESVSSLAYYNDASSVGSWAIPYVAYAYENNIMRGSGSAFHPVDNITREECLLIVARLVDKYDWAK